MTDYLTLVEVLAIHDDQIERYGGAQGVRDHGLLNPRSTGHRPGITPI
jgi:death-on-curing protein